MWTGNGSRESGVRGRGSGVGEELKSEKSE